MEKYGMYGGKFMPFHKGHLHCVEEALKYCEKLYLIVFVNGEQEQQIMYSLANRQSGGGYEWMDFLPEHRFEKVKEIAARYPDRVIPLMIDVGECRHDDGTENWDMETPLVLEACKEPFTIVFGSEESYSEYFSKAYHWAKYQIIDTDRKQVPISATKIRNMTEEEAKEWIV